MFMFYGWGSWLNTIIGLSAVLVYFVWYIYKKSENKILHTKFLLISSLVFLVTFYGSSLFFNKTKDTTSVSVSELLNMKSLEGQNIEFQQNKPIILNFWATWCPPCRAEMPELNNFAIENPQANFYAVNNISSEKEGLKGLNDFIASKNYKLPIIPDYNNLLTKMFEISSFPTTILLSPNGKILEKHVGVVSKETLEDWLQKSYN